MPEGAIVADSTVLIFLGKLRRLDWLRAAYETVLIPTRVYEEVVVNGKELGARDAVLVKNAIDDGWIEVHEIDPWKAIQKYDLEAGETEVLSLALDREHDEVLVNEESVRDVARLHDLRPRGMLYSLFAAVRDGESRSTSLLSYSKRSPRRASIWTKPSIWRRSERHASWLLSDASTLEKRLVSPPDRVPKSDERR